MDWRRRVAESVMAVPPLARRPDFSLDLAENRKLIRYLLDGGIRTFLYGGNANFYHLGVSEYRPILEFLRSAVSDKAWLIPSVSPMYGPMMDQGKILRELQFDTVMVLPATFPITRFGVEAGIRDFCNRFAIPVVLYLKNEDYLAPKQVERLFSDGLVSVIKYAVVREKTAEDPYLQELISLVDAGRIISGIGEQPAICHLEKFGLGGFTSGCVCIAPRNSMKMLRSLQSGVSGEDLGGRDLAEEIRSRFEPLETLRNTYGPIPVLHEAVRLAGIAETGPMLPLMSNLDETLWPRVRTAALALREYDERF